MGWLIFLTAGTAISCVIAQAAGRNRPGAWTWGLVGPIGWVIAAIQAVRPDEPSSRRMPRRAAGVDMVPPRECLACGASVSRDRRICPACGADPDAG